jgi:hypothetical protein
VAILQHSCLLFDNVANLGVFLRKELDQPSRWGDAEHSQKSGAVRGRIDDAPSARLRLLDGTCRWLIARCGERWGKAPEIEPGAAE